MDEPHTPGVALPDDEIDLRRLLDTLWRRRAVVLATAGVCALVAAMASLLLLQPIYESRAQILLSRHSAPAYASVEAAGRVLTGPAFLEPIARAAGLRDAGGPPRARVLASGGGDAGIIDLRIRYTDPDRLKVFSEAVVREFLRRASAGVEERRRTVERRLAGVTAQLNDVERDLAATRRTLERLQAGRPDDPASWVSRAFVVNALATSGQLYTGLLNAQRDLRNDLRELADPVVLQAPVVSAAPVSPRPLLTIGAALTMGVILGVILAFVTDALAAPAADRPPASVGSPSLR